MTKIILAYGAILALLILALKWLDFQFIVHDISLEIYVGFIAAICASIGIWMGLKLTTPKVIYEYSNTDFKRDEAAAVNLGISPREMDVLELISTGCSNQEIADKLFISLNTVKTHSSSLFVKLDVKRRTQAVQRAKQLNLIA